MTHARKLFAPIQVMLPPQERRTWRAAARRQRLTLSDFVRRAVRQQLSGAAPSTDPSTSEEVR